MIVCRIKDNTLNHKEIFEYVSGITHKVLNKTFDQLENEGIFIFPKMVRDSEDLIKEQMILQSINGSYQSGNAMGFLGYGSERLIIESRFSDSGNDYFFQYLLEKVLNFPNLLALDTDASQDNRLYHLLIFLFPYYLKIAMRKGIFKTYICNQYNNANVKGMIDIARHVRENTPFIGKIAYHQREFSYDNDLMTLVRHTIELIKKKPYGHQLLRQAKDEVSTVVEITRSYKNEDRRKIIAENIKNPIRHAYYHEYRALQQLCIMILQHEKHQIGSGLSKVYGVVFDGAWLWEEYMNLLIGNYFYHPMNKGGKGAQRLFAGNIGLIYPDFISRATDVRVIADAKYKPMDNIGNKDYLQVLAYMFRFDAKKGFYLYPERGNENDLKLQMNCGSTYENNVVARPDIQVVKYGLKVPTNVTDYEDFKKKINNSELALIRLFKNKIYV